MESAEQPERLRVEIFKNLKARKNFSKKQQIRSKERKRIALILGSKHAATEAAVFNSRKKHKKIQKEGKMTDFFFL